MKAFIFVTIESVLLLGPIGKFNLKFQQERIYLINFHHSFNKRKSSNYLDGE